MKLSQRFSSYDIEHHKRLIEEFKAHPDSCNDVWLSTLYGYPTPEKHRAVAEKLTAIADLYRKNGISVSLQISNTMGHGQYMSAADCSGLVYDGSPVENIVGEDGTVSRYSFCYRGKHFRKYILDTLEYYTAIKPDCLWVDDDFRLPNHAPVDFGCFCDNCIAEFNARYGSSFTRSELVNELLHGNLLWRERYLTFQREGMHDFMREIMARFISGSPDTVGGLQHAVPGGYIMGNHNFAFDAIKEVTGKAPKSRPGGGAYIDHDPEAFIKKGFEMAIQNAALPPYVTEIYPEIENLPHCVFGKSPAGTAFETSYYFICGASDMSYSIMQGVEPIEWYGTILELFSKQRKYWERISEYNSFTRATGLRHYYSKNDWTRRLRPADGIKHLHAYKHFQLADFLRDAIPVTFDRREESVLVLHPEEVSGLTAEDVDYLLGQSVITDGESIALLAEFGVELGITATKIDTFDALPLYEKYTDHPFNCGESYFSSSFFAKGKTECYRISVEDADVEILGIYNTNTSLPSFTDDSQYPFGIAELVLNTKKGGRWVIMGYQPWKANIPMVRRDRLLGIADSIASSPLAARIVSRHQAFVYPRVDGDGNTACVSVINCTIGKCEGGKLLIRSPRTTKFMISGQYIPDTLLPAERTSDGYLVELPALDAWTAATVFCI